VRRPLQRLPRRPPARRAAGTRRSALASCARLRPQPVRLRTRPLNAAGVGASCWRSACASGDLAVHRVQSAVLPCRARAALARRHRSPPCHAALEACGDGGCGALQLAALWRRARGPRRCTLRTATWTICSRARQAQARAAATACPAAGSADRVTSTAARPRAPPAAGVARRALMPLPLQVSCKASGTGRATTAAGTAAAASSASSRTCRAATRPRRWPTLFRGAVRAALRRSSARSWGTPLAWGAAPRRVAVVGARRTRLLP